MDEVKNWLELVAPKIEADEHFDALEDSPYVLRLNGRLVCSGLEAWAGGTLRLCFADNPSDPFSEASLEPREGGWVPEPAWVPARHVLREIVSRSTSPSVGQLDKTARPGNQCSLETTYPLW